MSGYLVKWEIDVEAGSHYEAAQEALIIMQDRSSEALVFDVLRWSDRKELLIDLSFEEEEEEDIDMKRERRNE